MADIEYPIVFRVADPLLVRVSELSLLVGNTNFYAKVKYGQRFKGFLIYCTGLGLPIYTENLSDSAIYNEIKESTSNIRMYANYSDSIKEDAIRRLAISWIDKLQDKINEQHTGSSVKEAIDRLCWQLHVDVTGSTKDPRSLYDFASYPSGQDFVDSAQECVNNEIEAVKNSLKSDEDEYTISKALRDSETSDESVSHQIEESLGPDSIVGTISDRIGTISLPDSAVGKLNSINNRLGSSADSISISQRLLNINEKTDYIDDIKSDTNDIKNNTSGISQIGTDIGTINSNIGDFSSKQYAGHSLSAIIGDNTISHQGYTVLGQLNDLMDK